MQPVTSINDNCVLKTRTYKLPKFENSQHFQFKRSQFIFLKDEEAWWKGSAPDGRTGVFPSNYVELIECKYHNCICF